MEQIRAGKKGYVVTPNPEIVYETLQDPVFRDIVNRASFVLPDGIGVIYLPRILGVPLAGKVPGIDFADALMYRMLLRGNAPVFAGRKTLGGRAGGGQSAKKISGAYHCRDTGRLFSGQTARQLMRSRQLVGRCYVHLSWSTQAGTIHAGHLDELPVTLSCGLGGLPDVFAGTVQRAPEIFIRLNLEWFYRLCKQPQPAG